MVLSGLLLTSYSAPLVFFTSTIRAKPTLAVRCFILAALSPCVDRWLDFDYDHKDILYVRIDRRRKMPATILFKGMGMSREQILDYFYKKEVYELDGVRTFWHVQKDLYRKDVAHVDLVDGVGEVVAKAGKAITKKAWRQLYESGVQSIEVAPNTLVGMFGRRRVSPETGEVMAQATTKLPLIFWA
jgi:DNA-directed RNA polymerase subunit beta (EC 2.7.7.6)